MAAERGHFIPPVIQDNPNGWGPTSVSDAFKGIPYQPFSKGDRLGKVGIAFRVLYNNEHSYKFHSFKLKPRVKKFLEM